MTTTYINSQGEDILIASMAHRHLVSAHAKLVREQEGDLRQDEIDAMADEIASREEQWAFEKAREAAGGVL